MECQCDHWFHFIWLMLCVIGSALSKGDESLCNAKPFSDKETDNSVYGDTCFPEEAFEDMDEEASTFMHADLASVDECAISGTDKVVSLAPSNDRGKTKVPAAVNNGVGKGKPVAKIGHRKLKGSKKHRLRQKKKKKKKTVGKKKRKT